MFRSISHIFTPILLAIAAAICTYSQATPNCPTITVSGPAGIPRPGEGFHFSATIEGKVPNEVSYKWTVSEGTIVQGQGTDKINALFPSPPPAA